MLRRWYSFACSHESKNNKSIEYYLKLKGLLLRINTDKKIILWYSKNTLMLIGVARIFDWGGPNHKSHAMTSSETSKEECFVGAKISLNGRSEALAWCWYVTGNSSEGEDLNKYRIYSRIGRNFLLIFFQKKYKCDKSARHKFKSSPSRNKIESFRLLQVPYFPANTPLWTWIVVEMCYCHCGSME